MRRGIVYVLPGIAILCLSVSQTDRQTVNTGLNRLNKLNIAVLWVLSIQ